MPSEEFSELEKDKKDYSEVKKKKHGAGPNLLKFFNKITIKSQAIFLVLHSAQNALGFRQAQLGRKDTPVALMWRPLSEKYVCFLMITERSSVSALF